MPEKQVYPRVGGGNGGVRRTGRVAGGLSPRGRGKQSRAACPGDSSRSIPAWAGETKDDPEIQGVGKVYPRVGGGNPVEKAAGANPHGLSPRGRGKPRPQGLVNQADRSIPAWAGETRTRATRAKAWRVYPRVGGGNTSTTRRRTATTGLSPRGRGKPTNKKFNKTLTRSIPAWAGETVIRNSSTAKYWVYPRVGGGNPRNFPPAAAPRGLSPRGRGKRPGDA